MVGARKTKGSVMADIETFYDASYHAALKVAREIATTNGRQGPVRRKDLLEGVMRVAPHAFSHLLGQKVILLGIPDLLPMPSALPAEKLTPAAERLIDLEHGWLGAVFADLKGPARHVEALHLAAALLFEGNQAVLRMLLYCGVQLPLPFILYPRIKARIARRERAWARLQRMGRVDEVDDLDDAEASEPPGGAKPAPRPASAHAAWRGAEERRRRLRMVRDALRRTVLGQRAACTALTRTVAARWLTEEPPARPLALAIAGPAGSGRHFLGETLQAALAEAIGAGNAAHATLDFAEFHPENEYIQDFVGYGKEWKGGAQEGLLTEPVADFPQMVYLVRNADRAGPRLLNVLRRALTEGEVFDQCHERAVSFAQATFVFVVETPLDTAALRLLRHGDAPSRAQALEALAGKAPLLANLLADVPLALTEPPDAATLHAVACRGLNDAEDFFAARGAPLLTPCPADCMRLALDSLDEATFGEARAMPLRLLMPALDALQENGARQIVATVDGFPPLRGETPPTPRTPANAWLPAHFDRLRRAGLRLRHTLAIAHKGETLRLTFRDLRHEAALALADGAFFSVTPAQASFADIVGRDHVRRALAKAIAWCAAPQGPRPDTGFLLHGAPGTGKTLLAKAAAAECGVPLIYVTGADFAAAMVGEGEAAVRKLFAAANRYPGSILFIDEIDALGNREGAHEASRRVLNLFLCALDGYAERRCVVIGATNRPGDLDPALMRPGRLARRFHFGPPDTRDERLRLIRHMARARGLALPPHAARFLADLTNSAPAHAQLRAIVDALRADDLSDTALIRALLDNTHGLSADTPSPATRRSSAWHEAGHAVAGLLLGHAPTFVTILPIEGGIGGLTQFPDVVGTRDAAYYLRDIDISLAGAIGEELDGAPVDGACSDFRSAVNSAKSYLRTQLDLSAILAEGDDAAVDPGALKALIGERLAATRKCLSDNRHRVAAVANALLEAETLTGDTLARLARAARPAAPRPSRERILPTPPAPDAPTV